MTNNLKLGSPLGGSCRDISTKAPVCWLMAFTFSPPVGPWLVKGWQVQTEPGRERAEP